MRNRLVDSVGCLVSLSLIHILVLIVLCDPMEQDFS